MISFVSCLSWLVILRDDPVRQSLTYARVSNLLQEAEPAGRDPLGDDDVSVVVKARVVRMHETSGLKTLRLTAKFEVVRENFFRPVLFVTQVRDHLVVLG